MNDVQVLKERAMQDVYLTAAGACLPGVPVTNDRMVRHLGVIDPQSERLGRLILRQNRIETRHYALTETGAATHSNASLAATALRDGMGNGGYGMEELSLLAAATTQGDLLVPGHASAVHGELGAGPLEIASFQSVCASSMMAAKYAALSVGAGEARLAAATGSEFSSRWFRPSFYAPAEELLQNKEHRMAVEFLRWTLSDGGGAVLFADRPGTHTQSYEVEWITLTSLADRFETCMIAGQGPEYREDLRNSWSFHPGGPAGSARDGAIMLYQDMVLLKRIIHAWVGEYLKLVDGGRVDPKGVDWLLCHYSAHSLREEIISLLKTTGGMIDEEKWFTNLPTAGNTGSASLFVMLDEFNRKGLARPGDKILCIVPESGRAVISFMMLTAL
ncbi:3-oxoacyl-[acyl-carrier-protein] synthase III C-terminal domain-containing protein [Parvularcula marina]|uniref:3-oxoacyl-[acyl-carrier-protein] synthase III C-terminal domain-containing protein n=2 Tax=Parvularcula marina TaxID=2292771 RepID=UPI0035598CE1